jgi:centractin
LTFYGSSVGRPKHIRVMAGALEGDVFIGRKAQEFRGLLKIKYPMEHGIVTDWDDMERIWSWVYAEELGTLSEEVCTCVILKATFNRRSASRIIDRSPIKPSKQSRCSSSNFL